MFTRQELDSFSFEIVKKIEFHGMEARIFFKSGCGLLATAPNKKALDQFIEECKTRLGDDLVIVR